MSSPELVAPSRLEELLAGAFPETQGEARLQGLARELRGAPFSAPASLRRNVESLEADGHSGIRVVRWRLGVVLAGCALGAALLAVTNLGSFDSGTGSSSSGAGGAELQRSTSAGDFESVGPKHQTAGGVSGLQAPAPTGRAQDVDMWIDLRVKDADEISFAAQQAQSITSELGGVVASSNVGTQGKHGHAQLILRIPVGKVNEANDRLSALGTITGQRVSTTDLQAPLDRRARRIEHLRSAIRIELARLASGQLDPAETLQAQIHLERLRSNLRATLRERAALAARAAMADLTLRLDTPSGSAPEKSESGITAAADKAVDFLRGAGAVAVFLALVLSPVVLLVVLASLALRARNRRLEARLLDDSQPGRPAEKPSQ
jgi:hypothetical protein